MFILLYYGWPIVLIASGALLGVNSVIYFRGGFDVKDATSVAVMLSAGIAAVAAGSYVVSKSGSDSEMREIYGSLLNYLWAWSLCAFILGLVFGFGLPR